MSSRSEPFECRWQPSRRLLISYLVVLALAVLAIGMATDAPLWLRGCVLAGCLLHAILILPRQVLLTHPRAVRGLRHDEHGWWAWSAADGWQAIQLRRDSLALPLAVVLRYRPVGQRWGRALCIPRDALARDLHRRLRVRLKFSRRRWQAPE